MGGGVGGGGGCWGWWGGEKGGYVIICHRRERVLNRVFRVRTTPTGAGVGGERKHACLLSAVLKNTFILSSSLSLSLSLSLGSGGLWVGGGSM